MIKKTVTFENLDGETESQDLWFHISKDEIIASIDSEEKDALLPSLMTVQALIEDDKASGLDIIRAMRLIIAKAYCEREGSGLKAKSKEASDAFLRSPAYEALLDDMIMDSAFAAVFVEGIFPKNLEKIAQAISVAEEKQPKVIRNAELRSVSLGGLQDEQSGLAHPRDGKGKLLPWAFRPPTGPELTKMNRQQLLEASQRQSSDWVAPPQVTDVTPV
jgi:hypothetical protein